LLHPAISTVCVQADVTQTSCWHAAAVDADPAADIIPVPSGRWFNRTVSKAFLLMVRQKYQLKKKSAELVTILRGQRLKLRVIWIKFF